MFNVLWDMSTTLSVIKAFQKAYFCGAVFNESFSFNYDALLNPSLNLYPFPSQDMFGGCLCGWQVARCSSQWEAIVSGFRVSGFRSEEAYGFISRVCKRSSTSKSEWLLWFSYLSLSLFLLRCHSCVCNSS